MLQHFLVMDFESTSMLPCHEVAAVSMFVCYKISMMKGCKIARSKTWMKDRQGGGGEMVEYSDKMRKSGSGEEHVRYIAVAMIS